MPSKPLRDEPPSKPLRDAPPERSVVGGGLVPLSADRADRLLCGLSRMLPNHDVTSPLSSCRHQFSTTTPLRGEGKVSPIFNHGAGVCGGEGKVSLSFNHGARVCGNEGKVSPIFNHGAGVCGGDGKASPISTTAPGFAETRANCHQCSTTAPLRGRGQGVVANFQPRRLCGDSFRVRTVKRLRPRVARRVKREEHKKSQVTTFASHVQERRTQ